MAKLGVTSLMVLAGAFAFGRCLADGPIMLWKSAAVGMTAAEVRRSVLDASPNPKPDTNNDGWVSLLTERDRTNHHDQKVDFQFQNDRLMGVTVVEGERFGLASIGQEDVRAIFAKLRETYGTPFQCRDQNGGGQGCFWLKDGKFIGYLGQAQSGSYAMVFLHKEKPGDRDLLK